MNFVQYLEIEPVIEVTFDGFLWCKVLKDNEPVYDEPYDVPLAQPPVQGPQPKRDESLAPHLSVIEEGQGNNGLDTAQPSVTYTWYDVKNEKQPIRGENASILKKALAGHEYKCEVKYGLSHWSKDEHVSKTSKPRRCGELKL